MSHKQIYFRYVKEHDISIEVLNDNGEVILLIRQKNKAPIREVLNVKIEKGV